MMRPEEGGLLLVDGYSIIHSWIDLRKVARKNLEEARRQLIRRLSLYQDYTGTKVKIVFDGASSGRVSSQTVMGIEVIFSSRDKTADTVIERLVSKSERRERERIRVATSDAEERMMVFGLGAQVISAQDLEREVSDTLEEAKSFIREEE